MSQGLKKIGTFIKDEIITPSNTDLPLPKITTESIISLPKNMTSGIKTSLTSGWTDNITDQVYTEMFNFFPFYSAEYNNVPVYSSTHKENIKGNNKKLQDKLNDYKTKYDDLLSRGMQNILDKKLKTEEYAREDKLRLEDNVNGVTGYVTKLIVKFFSWVGITIISSLKNAFTTGWNKTITGFLILVFIIVLIFVIPKMKKRKTDKKKKNESKNFMSILLSIPEEINLAFSNFSIMIEDVVEGVNNTTDTINNTITSMNALSPDLRDRGKEDSGRGGDNLFHIKGEYIGKTGDKSDKIYNIYKPKSQSFYDVSIPSKIDADKYVLDCSIVDTSNIYIDSNCVLKPHVTAASDMPDIDKTDYINIEL
jgi:ABC-type multidrug transport system fused ATPase/permease subunit